MQKMKCGSKHGLLSLSLKVLGLLFLFVIAVFINSCGKTTKYPNNQTYDKHVDTATLVIKITNLNNQPIDVSTQPTTLLLFDSKNLYYTQILSKEGINTKDTSITINGIPMGHYTALLIVNAPGIINLNYLAIGKQSYQNVLDTLQYLLTDTYVASTQGIIVNNKINTGSVNFEPLVSLISQVSFDLSGLMNTPIWQNPKLEDYGLYFLVFQNNTLVMSRPIKNEDIKEGMYQIPIAKGANYSFMFTDLVNESTSPANKDSMINGKTTPEIVQQKLETHIDNIRMGTVGIGSPLNLVKTEQQLKVSNGIKSVPVVLQGTTIPQWSNSTNDWSLLIFDQTGFLKRIINPASPIITNPSPKDALIINVFNGSPYTLLAIGNAPGAVGKYQAQNIANPINAEYVNSNLQSIQENIYSWVAMGNGIIASMMVGGQFNMTPEVRRNFNKIDAMTIAEVRKQTGNYFADNPRRVTGIVTSIGKVENGVNENPIPNLIILQDAQNAAIPIQVKNDTSKDFKNLKIGDQISIALQDGLMTTSNTNANNTLVLQDVTYTQVSKQSSTGIPSPKVLTLAEAIDPTTYQKYESMLVEIKDLEFKWCKDITYGTYSPDSTILRDNNATTAPTTTLPSDRKIIRMVTSRNATVKFSGTPIPLGKVNSITGFLVKTPSGNKNIAIMPRISTDISGTEKLEDRVDKGVVAWWGNGGSTSNYVANSGVCREETNATINTNLAAAGGSLSLYDNALYIYFPKASNNNGRGIIFTLNTSNLSKNEDVRLIWLNGIRWGGLAGGYSDLTFDLQYSLDNGKTWKTITNTSDGQPTTFKSSILGSPATTYSFTGVSSSATADIKGIGGYNNVQILVNCTGGKTSQTLIASNDRYWQIYNLKIEQIQP